MALGTASFSFPRLQLTAIGLCLGSSSLAPATPAAAAAAAAAAADGVAWKVRVFGCPCEGLWENVHLDFKYWHYCSLENP